MQNYQTSYLVSPENNERINSINTKIENIMAVGVLISSFLVLSIEKNWWGGHLSWEESGEKENMAYSDVMISVYHIKSRF
jgi:hypothetical protein